MNKVSLSTFLAASISIQYGLFLLLVFYFDLIPAFYLSLSIITLLSVWVGKRLKVQVHFKELIFPSIILLIYFTKIYFSSVTGWDSRSIWLFHTKIIYLANGFKDGMDWNHPTINWSHTDYPKLGPVLGAFFVKSGGEWNELCSRFSWFALLVPPVLFLNDALKGIFGKWFQVFIYLFVGPILWTGYMDGYLALYLFCAFIFMLRFLESEQNLDFAFMVTCLSVAVCLKNEAVLMTVVMFVVTFASGLKKIKVKNLMSLLLFLPFLNWLIYKKSNLIFSEFKFLSSETFSRLVGRLTDGDSVLYLLRSMFFYERKIFYTLLIFVIYFISIKLMKLKLNQQSKIGLVLSLLYVSGLMFVYLSTPYDLDFHVRYSVGRITLGVNLMMLYLLYQSSNRNIA